MKYGPFSGFPLVVFLLVISIYLRRLFGVRVTLAPAPDTELRGWQLCDPAVAYERLFIPLLVTLLTKGSCSYADVINVISLDDVSPPLVKY